DQLNDAMSTAPIPGRVLCCRIECKGFRPQKIFLFTTLLDPTLYTAEELCQLYGLRSHVELNLRYVKEQLDLAELRGKSPDSIRKELYSGLLTYNLIRATMAAAAAEAKISPLKLSFTSCWRRLRPELIKLRTTDGPEYIAEVLRRLLARLRKCKLPQRKVQRFEPRAVRTRPRPYPVLVGDRKKVRKKYMQELKAQAPVVKS
ncbi:MAG: transposase, partial [candidate division KSB1 bacterium]|nr:transposase [candidate division KSB1 bacterium]